MAQWLEPRTGDRGVLKKSNPAAATSLRNFGKSVYPNLPMAIGGDTKIHLSGVFARGSKISHTGGICITCRGLHNSEIKPLLC